MSKKNKASSAKKSNTKKAVKSAGAKKVAKPAKQKPVKKVLAKKPVSTNSKKAKPSKVSSKKAEVKSLKKGSAPITKTKKEEKVKVTAVKTEKKPNVKTAIAPAKKLPTKSSAIIEKQENEIEIPVSKKGNDPKTQSNEVLAISNTIPKTKVTPISASKIASISSSITNPIKKLDSYSVKVEKEPNGKFELEFVVRSSPEMLFEFLSSPSGLSEWFCDDVNIRNGIYTFIWDGTLQQARLLKTHDYHLVRFQWVEKTDGSYFEFRIQRDDLTNDISLIITDFAESNSERESSKRLWQSQVEKLLQIIGSIH